MVATGFALFVVSRGSSQVSWARLNTQDVHSLAFVGGDPQRLLFGHHFGVLETRDGGRNWQKLDLREDAMSMALADDGSIVIAGHEVFTASRDGGTTWAPIETDLPNIDIHGFTRDPVDPARMWAYLATGGLWESTDFGAHFAQVRTDNVIYPLAVIDGDNTRLVGVDTGGLTTSVDGGRTWSPLETPPTYPMTALAATPDGRDLYAGSSDALYRSEDGGRTWNPTAYKGSAFAIAVTPDGRSVGVVSRSTEFFRSSDAGASWPGP
jgi:photosystem II stability/assembly factor-like uncharacterized protein